MPPRKGNKGKAEPTGLTAKEVATGSPPKQVVALEQAIEAAGGAVLVAYRDPLGGHWLVLAALPAEAVEATPYQRELSKTHVERLMSVIPKVGRFLDPVIAVRHGDRFWTPNGMHRLAAARKLGARAITALVVPDPEIAYRILALNTEKAHNLKDRSLEVIRMARDLAADAEMAEVRESHWAFEFEEPAYLTLGVCYQERARFAGSTYMPVLKRCETFSDEPIAAALATRDSRAAALLSLDDEVNAVVERLKKAGFKSAYLKPFVVARINPLRFVKARRSNKGPAADFDEVVAKMTAKAAALDVSKIKPQDLAGAAGYAGEE